MYRVLLRLPSTHYFFATLFCWLLLDDPDPTAKWCESKIKLIYKDRDKNDPANFRPISLTSCVGKVYHQILVDRMDLYLSSNRLIDTTVEKAFMRGISGCTDHNLVLQELLAYARKEKKIARFLTLLMPLALSVMITLRSLWRGLNYLPRLFSILLLFILSRY
jgi:hypothetical protein